MRDIILEQVERLLAEQGGVALLRRVEAGEWPAVLWAQCEELGLPLALVPEEAGGAGLAWADAAGVWQVLGRHAAPLPLGEAMLANALLAGAGLEPAAGFVTLGTNTAPFGRHASAVLRHDRGHVALHMPESHTPHANLAREPRDRLTPGAMIAEGQLPNAWGARAAKLGLALLRAALMSGAAQHALALAVDWANTRTQFGRAIGKFQAVQQSLAVVAGEVAALDVAVATAARAVDARGMEGAAFEIACAKVIAAEAAQVVAARVHQAFAAIGITEDHELHHFTRRLWAWRDEAGSAVTWAGEIGRAAMERGGARLWADLTARDVEGTTA
jgi:acyl-CoA dehydrogenase